MPAEISEKINVKNGKPPGQGVIRFFILRLLVDSRRPLTLRQIHQELYIKDGILIHIDTVRAIVPSELVFIPKKFILKEKTVRVGPRRIPATAYLITQKRKQL